MAGTMRMIIGDIDDYQRVLPEINARYEPDHFP